MSKSNAGFDMAQWNELFHSIEHRESPGSPLPKPTDSALNDYEERTHFRLPKSYRSFIKVFGPGMLGNDFSIRAPGYRVAPTTEREEAFNWWVDLDSFDNAVKTTPLVSEEGVATTLFQDIDRIRKCVYFASNTGNEVIGWDPSDVREAHSFEYGVYILLRETNQLVLLTETFSSFIMEVCFGPRYGQIVSPPDGDGYVPPRCFEPQGG